MSWNKTITSNKINMHHVFNAYSSGVNILQVFSTKRAGNHSFSHMLVWIKTEDYMEGLVYLDMISYLIDVISTLVIVHAQGIMTNTHLIVQRLLKVEGT